MNKSEFDQFADEYYTLHAGSLSISGEQPEFFAEYKIIDLAGLTEEYGIIPKSILDFGSGIGNSIPWFRKYFSASELICADVSERSLELSKQRYPGNEKYLELHNSHIEIPDCSVDLVFSACVFHHIPHEEHSRWLFELQRIIRPGGLIVIFEHNPINPITVATVKSCPFDKNAHLISATKMRHSIRQSGWAVVNIRYRIFFPHRLSMLRPLERLLRNVPIGAQYCIFGQKSIASSSCLNQ